MASNIIFLLSCAMFATVCHADVSSLRYNRFGRPISTRLQRQEVATPTPYPSAGFRPDRQFALPSQFFPEQQPESSSNGGNGASDEKSLQRPELIYGAPSRLRQFSATPARQQLQSQQGYAAPQQLQPQQGYAAPQQLQPQQEYAAPQQLQPQQGYAAPQQLQPQQEYAAPQNTFSSAPARLQLQSQQTFLEPQQTYGAPIQALEPQAERLTVLKSARLSDNREDQEEDDDVESNIEVDVAMEEKKAVVASPPAAAAAATVAYYPAGALGLVQPLSAFVQPNAAYNTGAGNYFAKLQVQPASYVASAPLTAAVPASVAPIAQIAQPQAFASPFFQPQFAYSAPSQLQAW